MIAFPNGLNELNDEQWFALYDRCARHYLNMTGQEFIVKWNAGELDLSHERDNHTAITQVWMLCPQELLAK